jgi:hypothetical protein
MMTGHLSALGFVAMSAALAEEDRGRPLLSGLALSVCVYKPTLLVLLLPMLIVTRRFRTLTGFASGSIVLALFATAIQGIRLWSGYVPMLFSFGSGAARVQTHTFKEVWKYVDAASFSSLIQPELPAGVFRLLYPILLACIGCAALWLIRTWWRSAGAVRPASTIVWTATLTWTLVLNVYVPIYDCILIVLVVITTAGVLMKIPGKPYSRCFGVVWFLILACSWITIDVAEKTGFQIITPLLAALGILQLILFGRMTGLKGLQSVRTGSVARPVGYHCPTSLA